jgi:hypothetical protein
MFDARTPLRPSRILSHLDDVAYLVQNPTGTRVMRETGERETREDGKRDIREWRLHSYTSDYILQRILEGRLENS